MGRGNILKHLLLPSFDDASEIPDLHGKVILITGGAHGVGLETAKAILEHEPARLYLTYRNEETKNYQVDRLSTMGVENTVRFLKMDLASIDDINAAAIEFMNNETRLDILINNAHVAFPGFDAITADGYELHFGANYIGTVLFTQQLLAPMLHTASQLCNDVRVIFIAAFCDVSFKDRQLYDFRAVKEGLNDMPSTHRYLLSKIALMQYMTVIAQKFESVKFVAVYPGTIERGRDTTAPAPAAAKIHELLNPQGRLMSLRHLMNSPVSASQGAKCLLWAAFHEKIKSGRIYFPIGRPVRQPRQIMDSARKENLWLWTQQELAGNFTSEGLDVFAV